MNNEQNSNNAQNQQLNIAGVSTRFYRRNEYPKVIEQLWEKEPTEGERVEVDYGIETNTNVWWVNGKFVNKYGFEMYNIIGWRSLNGC